MSPTTAEKTEEAPSRLQMVRSGGVGTIPRVPLRGRITVSIEDVIADPKNERKEFKGIDELARSIEAVGIIEPPTVVPVLDDAGGDTGKYKITTGERRWRAAKQAGIKQIPVIVGDTEAEHRRRQKSLISNIQRADLGAIEVAQALQSMREDDTEKLTNRDLAARIGKSEQWVAGMLKIVSLPPKIQKKIAGASRPVPYDVAQEIARVTDETKQAELLEHALAGAKVREVRDKAREMKGKQPAARATATQRKIPWGGGEEKNWVIVHKSDGGEVSKEDCVKALKEALRAVERMEF